MLITATLLLKQDNPLYRPVAFKDRKRQRPCVELEPVAGVKGRLT